MRTPRRRVERGADRGEDGVIVGSSQVEDEASGVVLFDAGDSPGRGGGGDVQPVGEGEFERMKDQQIAMLQRDAYFHREANRELKRRLRDMDKREQAVESRRAAQEAEMRKLQDVNASLMEELANLKVRYYRPSSPPIPLAHARTRVCCPGIPAGPRDCERNDYAAARASGTAVTARTVDA